MSKKNKNYKQMSISELNDVIKNGIPKKSVKAKIELERRTSK